MDLEKRINSEGVVRESYFVVIEPQIDDYITSVEEYIDKPSAAFKIPDREEEVLESYTSCPHRIPIKRDEVESREIIKHDGKYWVKGHGSNMFNHDKTRMIKVWLVHQIDLQEMIPNAIRNLTRYVKGELSAGDRVHLRGIATEAFLKALDLAADDSGENYTLSMCLRMYDNEFAHMQLRQFGFDLKEPHGLYTDYQRITRP